MEVLALRDKPDPIVSLQPPALEDPLKGRTGLGVDDQQLVLVELDLEREFRVHDGDRRAAVVEQEILVFPEHALEHQPLHALAGEFATVGGGVVRGFEDHVAAVAERLEQVEERGEQVFTRHGGDHGRHPGAGPRINVRVVPEAGLGHHVEVPAWADRFGEREPAVPAAGEVGFHRGAVGGGGLFAGGGNRPQDRGGERRAGVVEETHGWTGRDGGCLRRAPESKGTTNLGHAFAPCGPAASPRKPPCAAPRVADPEAGAS